MIRSLKNGGTPTPSGVEPSAAQAIRRPSKETLLSNAFSWRDALSFGVLYIVAVANQHLMTSVLLGLAVWAMIGSRHAICAMTVVAILRYANAGFASFSPYASILFWLVMIVGSVRIILSFKRVPASFHWLLAFSIFSILISVTTSQAVDVSVMKVVSFFVVSSAMLIASESLESDDILRLQRWFLSIVIFVAISSLLTLVDYSLAYRLNGRGFQGIFAHPQHLGVFFVPFVSWGLIRAVNDRRVKLVPIDLFILLVGIVIIVMSQARTAILATFVTVLLTTTVHLFRNKAVSYSKDLRHLVGVVVLVLFAALAVLSTGGGATLVEEIVFKGSGTTELDEAFEQSRGAGVKQHLENFADAPLMGHGFGVYRQSIIGGDIKVKRFWGLPISAPTEKGFAFTSVLEEVGIVGALLFYGLVLSMGRSAAMALRPEILALFAGAILINFGEAVIFSPGGIGLFMWLVIALSLASARLDRKDNLLR